MNNTMMIGERIKEIRESKKYTQKQLAKALNITTSCMSKYETGRTQPPPEMLMQIADVLNISLDYMFGRTGFAYEYKNLEGTYVKNIKCFDVLNRILRLNVKNRNRLVDYIYLLENDMNIDNFKKHK